MKRKKIIKTRKKSSAKKKDNIENIKDINDLPIGDQLISWDNNDDLDKSHMVTVKTSLLSVLRRSNIVIEEFNKSFKEILDDVIDRVHKIIFHTYGALKAYNIKKLDDINNNFIFDVGILRYIMNTISSKNQTKGKKTKETDEIRKDFQKFFDEHYKKILTDEDYVNRDNLKRILNYEEKCMITCISNNIKEHFIKHLRFLIFVSLGFKEELDQLKLSKKYDEIKNIRSDYNQIVSDILNVDDKSILADKKYHEFIIFWRDNFIPIKDSFEKNSIPYDIKANEFDYFPQMILMNKVLELYNKNIIEKHTDPKTKPATYKLFNILPLRTSIIPKSITIDTPGLISLFIKKGQAALIKKQKDPVFRRNFWNKFFKLESKTFKRKGYKFAYMIRTDGVSCSLIFHKTDENGIPLKKPSSSEQKQQSKERKKMEYIEDVHITPLMKHKKIVTIDPNKYDMISAMKEDHEYGCNKKNCKELGCKKYIYFEYTRGRRNKDRKKEKADKKRKELLKEKIGGKTIEQIQSELSNYNSKTCNFREFMKYQQKKIEINRILYEHYKNEIYRILNFRNHVNTKRSESLMLNRFKEIMGSPNDIIIILGDYSDTGLAGTPPSITIKLRKLFKDAGYNVFLIDEYNTSKTCSCCGNKVESFIEIKRDKKKWKNDKKLRKKHKKILIEKVKEANILLSLKTSSKKEKICKLLGLADIPETKKNKFFAGLKDGLGKLEKLEIMESLTKLKESSGKVVKKITKWKLLRCTSCNAIHNRDHNATKNMMKIVKSIFEKKGRPQEYKRPDFKENNGLKKKKTNERK